MKLKRRPNQRVNHLENQRNKSNNNIKVQKYHIFPQ